MILNKGDKMSLLYIFLIIFVFMYIMTILQIIIGNVDSLPVKLFCYRTTTLKELQSYEGRLRKIIKIFYTVSMGFNLIVLFIFIYYPYSGNLHNPVIFFFIPVNQLVTPIIISYLVKSFKKYNRIK